jgi:tetratricopeptide (TPR) repeat protein
MRAIRLLYRPLPFVVAALAVTASAGAQDVSVQKLLERGMLEQAVQRAEGERENPESTYLAAQAAAKMNDNGRAAQEYGRLRESSDEAWKAIGESGARLNEGDLNGAMEAANRAVAAADSNPYAHYQVGTVASRQGNHQRAFEAFSRAATLKPDLAYAHYYAGSAAQRVKEIARMSEHFETFVRLAPDAPERTAVAALLRTLRPRY